MGHSGASSSEVKLQQSFTAEQAAAFGFRERVFGTPGAGRMEQDLARAMGRDVGSVYGATRESLLSLGTAVPVDPSWSAAKRTAYVSFGHWATDVAYGADPAMGEQLYGWLSSQRGNPDVARLLSGIDPKTRTLRSLDPDELRRLFLGG